jgi:hypothetical protein
VAGIDDRHEPRTRSRRRGDLPLFRAAVWRLLRRRRWNLADGGRHERDHEQLVDERREWLDVDERVHHGSERFGWRDDRRERLERCDGRRRRRCG